MSSASWAERSQDANNIGGQNMSEYHIPVLLDESISALINSHSGTYADATFGGGGHSKEILKRLSPEGRLISFDRDSDAIANRPDDNRLTLIRSDFR